mmetsp:Transcript_8770/g.7750  ORF Transcript_8770/g.7750 Transcript_8770/m.7750 type:complete len:90 (-) Transcript_8770:159-428(-)
MQDEPIPKLTDAILIPRTLIEDKNVEIRKQGKLKTEQMEQITDTRFEVESLRHEILILEWRIKDVEAKTNEVKRLKVKKEMQIALTRKD